jgi:hypothetical protein
MSSAVLGNRTRQLLEEAPIQGSDVDAKVRQLLSAEYLHKISQYRRTDSMLSQKYGITFEQFVTRRVVRENRYSQEAETDAMAWETAISGMMTMERKLGELREAGLVPRE